MPGFQIHIAIGKRYIKKHKIENTKDFLRGTIAPDFVEDKSKSHYTRKNAEKHTRIKKREKDGWRKRKEYYTNR